jgi:xeroderma pigmentosum group C-complementing protein
MVGRKRKARNDADLLPDIYHEMLAEAGVDEAPSHHRTPQAKPAGHRPQATPPAPTVQTMDMSSDDEDDDEDIEFEDVEIGQAALPQPQLTAADELRSRTAGIEVDFTARQQTSPSAKRKALSNSEKERRIEIHRMHVLCLLSHCARRNRWCNDPVVQDALRPMLSDKTIKYLNPGTNLSQFGRTESLKRGLQEAGKAFRAKFNVTERGLRRALWAEDPEHLKKVGRGSDHWRVLCL